jgi:Winged helix DNA-binding domain
LAHEAADRRARGGGLEAELTCLGHPLVVATLDIAHRRLFSQRLLGAELRTPNDVVSWLGAVQAQDYAGAKWALAMRTPSTTDADVEQAFASGAILRTHLLRPTWHFITPADIRWVLSLTAPRVQAANAYMYRKLGLDDAAFRRSNDTLLRALQGGQHLTREELRDVLHAAGVPADGEFRMGYLMMRAELDGILCSGPRRGKQFTYALLDERVPPSAAFDREEALASLAHRFFSSRGPATVQDFAKWSGMTATDAKKGLEAVTERLNSESADGKTYWFAASTKPRAKQRVPTAHLLSIYDEYVSGYKDRSAIVSARNGARLMAMGNALTSIVVVNGQITGTWKRRVEKGTADIRIELFDRLTKAEHQALKAAVQAYVDFLGMPAAQK